MENNKPPLLSVCLITYNHASFIRQAIEGVLMQKLDFEWEFIIADDFSTDGTREIVKEYAQRFPRLIITILQAKNVGASKNWFDLLNAAKGKYIAYFEGDDYWTDEFKLKKQVGFLESHSEYSACCHNAPVLNGNGELVLNNYIHNNKDLPLETVLRKLPVSCIPTCSLVFRSKVLEKNNWWFEMAFGDAPLWLDLLRIGKIYGMQEEMAVYRKHAGGFTHAFNWDGYQEGYSKFYKAAKKAVAHKYHSVLNEHIFFVFYHTGSQFLGKKQFLKGWNSYKKMLFSDTFQVFKHLFQVIIFSIKILTYPLYRMLK